MLNIEQLLYFDKLRSGMNADISKCNRKIFEAQQIIVAEEENIRHLKYDIDLMVTILTQTDAKWAEKISKYYQQD